MSTMNTQNTAVSSSSFQSLFTDPEVKQFYRAKLNLRSAELQSELSRVQEELKALEPTVETPTPTSPAPSKPKAKKGSKSTGKKRGRPAGKKSVPHASAVVEVVKNNPGSKFSAIMDQLTNQGHSISKTVLSASLANLVKKGQLSRSGEVRAYSYTVAAT